MRDVWDWDWDEDEEAMSPERGRKEAWGAMFMVTIVLLACTALGVGIMLAAFHWWYTSQ